MIFFVSVFFSCSYYYFLISFFILDFCLSHNCLFSGLCVFISGVARFFLGGGLVQSITGVPPTKTKKN